MRLSASMIEPFVHRSPAAKVVFGAGALASLAGELAELGVRRPMLLTGRRTAASPIYARVCDGLSGLACETFDAVPEHSSVEIVEALALRAREQGIDGFVAVGGGSASDTAKAVALLLAEGGPLERHASRFTPPDRLVIPALPAAKLPIAAVPCTASAAEVTPSLGVRSPDGTKLLFSDVKLASRLIVIDPAANVCVPARLMLSTGMNGLAHCVEGLYSKVRTPVTSALAADGIARFMKALPAVAREPESAAQRGELLVAAHLSGQVLLNARTCLHHAICHVLGASTGIAHGDANSVMLPEVVRFNGREDLAESVRALRESLGVPTRLRDLGVAREALGPVAAHVMGERGLYFNPRTVRSPEEVLALLESAW
jgi:alcohol dehydrogenase class IV